MKSLTKIYRVILLTSLILWIVSCKPTYLFIAENHLGEFINKEELTLPSSFKLTEKIEEATMILTVDEVFSQKDEHTPERYTLSRVCYAPALPYWDQRHSIEFDKIKGLQIDNRLPDKIEKDSGVKILPFEKVKLPWKAVAVDKFLPSEREYKLYRDVFFTLEAKKKINQRRLNELQEWAAMLSLLNQEKLLAQDEDIFWLGGVGDILPIRGVDRLLLNNKNGIELVFTDVLPILQKQDFLIGNLETAVTTHPTPLKKTYTFKANPRVLPELKKAGFDYFTLTNNHAYDYGEQGFRDTLKYLSQNSIPTSGVGLNIDEAFVPFSVDFPQRETRLKIMSLGSFPIERSGFNGQRDAAATESRPGMLWHTEETLKNFKEIFSEKEFFNIVSIHAGAEYSARPGNAIKKIMQSHIDNGANLVLGHHPHVLHGIEVYNGGLIVYSMGNFIFSGMGGMKNAEESIVVTIGLVENEIKYLNYYPVKINDKVIELDRGSIGSRFEKMSRELYFD
ncbi:MAG: CapA family protein [Spirochaetales bacterium]|nr:CapA family protein [Spirochaetales bacterium]